MASSNPQKGIICLRKDCGKEFDTMSGRSKHHKKCEKEIVQTEKGYVEDKDGGKVTCVKCNNVLSDVPNWYRQQEHACQPKEKKSKKLRKVTNALCAPKNLL